MFALALSRLPHVTVRVLDEPCVLHALTLAAQQGLRGADAVYAAVAQDAGSTLVTLDNEHLTRLADLLPVCTPAAALATGEELKRRDLGDVAGSWIEDPEVDRALEE